MNQYPAWKYLLILIVLMVGVLYALPNLFGEDPAVQVTSTRGFAISADLDVAIEEALANEQIGMKDREQVGNRLLYRFESTADQIRAVDVLKRTLGEQYVVALNLAPSTPGWMRAIGGKPMTLGLDLQGGVHFLMQVDMDTARGQQLDRFVDDRLFLRGIGLQVEEEGAKVVRIVVAAGLDLHGAAPFGEGEGLGQAYTLQFLDAKTAAHVGGHEGVFV